MKNGWSTTTLEDNMDSGVLSNPLSFTHDGFYNYITANLGVRGDQGFYWSLRSANTTRSSVLGFIDNLLDPQSNNSEHAFGDAVRCIASGGLAPDSICPKGWQLPTYEGDKSFTTLINTSYSMKNDTQITENDIDAGALSNPLSLLRSGVFGWHVAGLYDRGGYGYYWSLRSDSTTHSSNLRFGNTDLNPQYSDARGGGFAVRCVSVYGINSLF